MATNVRPVERDADQDINRSLSAIDSMLKAVYSHKGVPTDTRHCLDQLAAEVKGLADAYRRLSEQSAPRTDAPEPAPAPMRTHWLPDAMFLGNLGRPVPTADDAAGLRKLTPQERRILQFIAEGCTNRQIANELYLAEKTVKNYVSNMLRKLGMERRTQAAVYATRLDQALLARCDARSGRAVGR